jgi:hypothetical protein
LKLSAFIELLTLSILIKKVFKKAFISTTILSKYFDEKIPKNRKNTSFLDSFDLQFSPLK